MVTHQSDVQYLGGKTRVSEEDKADKVSAVQASSGQETESTSNPGTLLWVTLRAWQPFPSLLYPRELRQS